MPSLEFKFSSFPKVCCCCLLWVLLVCLFHEFYKLFLGKLKTSSYVATEVSKCLEPRKKKIPSLCSRVLSIRLGMSSVLRFFAVLTWPCFSYLHVLKCLWQVRAWDLLKFFSEDASNCNHEHGLVDSLVCIRTFQSPYSSKAYPFQPFLPSFWCVCYLPQLISFVLHGSK